MLSIFQKISWHSWQKINCQDMNQSKLLTESRTQYISIPVGTDNTPTREKSTKAVWRLLFMLLHLLQYPVNPLVMVPTRTQVLLLLSIGSLMQFYLSFHSVQFCFFNIRGLDRGCHIRVQKVFWECNIWFQAREHDTSTLILLIFSTVQLVFTRSRVALLCVLFRHFKITVILFDSIRYRG